jgi:hypothetical protein
VDSLRRWRRIPFFYFEKGIDMHITEGLYKTRPGPFYLQRIDGRGAPDAHMLPERVGAKTATRIHVFVYRPQSPLVMDDKSYPRSYRGPVALNTLQVKRDPVIFILPGIDEKKVLIGIPMIRAAHIDIDIFVAVVIDICKSNSVPFLKIPCTRNTRHILKPLPAVIPEKLVRE